MPQQQQQQQRHHVLYVHSTSPARPTAVSSRGELPKHKLEHKSTPSKCRTPTCPTRLRGCLVRQYPHQRPRRLFWGSQHHYCYDHLLTATFCVAAAARPFGNRRHPNWEKRSSGRRPTWRVPSAVGHPSIQALRSRLTTCRCYHAVPSGARYSSSRAVVRRELMV